jgi:hypothetical protein
MSEGFIGKWYALRISFRASFAKFRLRSGDHLNTFDESIAKGVYDGGLRYMA